VYRYGPRTYRKRNVMPKQTKRGSTDDATEHKAPTGLQGPVSDLSVTTSDRVTGSPKSIYPYSSGQRQRTTAIETKPT